MSEANVSEINRCLTCEKYSVKLFSLFDDSKEQDKLFCISCKRKIKQVIDKKLNKLKNNKR